MNTFANNFVEDGEFEVTSFELYREEYDSNSLKSWNVPVEPEVIYPNGEGWRLVGMAANATHLFWTWHRPYSKV